MKESQLAVTQKDEITRVMAYIGDLNLGETRIVRSRNSNESVIDYSLIAINFHDKTPTS